MIGSAEGVSFWVQDATRRDVRDTAGERGREAVVAESNPANRDYGFARELWDCLLYTSPSPRDRTRSRMPSSA